MSSLMLDKVVNALFEALANHTVEGTGQTLTLQGGKLDIELTCDARAVAHDLVKSLRALSVEAQVEGLAAGARHFDELEADKRLERNDRIVLTVYALNGQFLKAGYGAMIDAIAEERV